MSRSFWIRLVGQASIYLVGTDGNALTDKVSKILPGSCYVEKNVIRFPVYSFVVFSVCNRFNSCKLFKHRIKGS